VFNPARGFVSSANQTPADATYPYYLNWRFEVVTRGTRVNQRLSAMSGATVDSLRMLQFDNRNMIAEFNLSIMLSMVDYDKLNETQKEIYQRLKTWDRNATATSIEQSVFHRWWKNLSASIWHDEFGSDSLLYPTDDITMNTVHYNINRRWVDDQNTPATETLSQLLQQSFSGSCDSLMKYFGNDPANWQWGEVKNTQVTHLLRLPAFSRSHLNTSGNALIVNATGVTHGPSWRMIVEMKKNPVAYGIYPGGQSGNPGSPFYDNMIERWARGEQQEILILHSADEKNNRILSTLTLNQ
jgi:penicillin amidase